MKRTMPAWLTRLLPLSLTLFAVIADQVTKALAVTHLKPIDTFPLIRDVLHFTYRTNTGAAFSIFSAPDQRWIFMTVSSVAICAMLAYLLLAPALSRMTRYALAAVIGGGIGNMIDRIFAGYVVDFIDVRLINFAVFNVADCFVCVGVGFLVLSILLEMIAESRCAKAAGTAGQDHDDRPAD